MTHRDQEETRLPPAVTFTSGAELLMKLGIVESITREGVRYIAENHPAWPFGVDRPYPYGRADRALLMATGPFLDFFRENPPARSRSAKHDDKAGGAS